MLILPDNINAHIITADPPIPFKTWSRKGEGRSPQHHYKCAAFDELAAIPVASIAAPDCFLLMWIPLRSIDWVIPLMDAWGFEFSGSGFVWIKLNPKGNAEGWIELDRKALKNWFMGGGYGTRHNAEVCWLGRRGKPQRKSKGVRELIVAPVREHSRKPDEIYARCEALADGPYVELFARQQWPKWICIGDEVGKFQREAEGTLSVRTEPTAGAAIEPSDSGELFRYVRHVDVPRFEASGWERLPALDQAHHGCWSALMRCRQRNNG